MSDDTNLDVRLIASTRLTDQYPNAIMPILDQSTDAETLVTFAGRSCYGSFHRPRIETAEDRDYIRRTALEQQHGSILEHASATFYVTGVSRSLLAELSRHRHLSFSVESQRFVDSGASGVVVPPALDGVPGMAELLDEHAARARARYAHIVSALQSAGHTRKQAREAARSVLPESTETRIVVTGNLRAWQHVVALRSATGADAEIQRLAVEIDRQLGEVMPSVFSTV